MVTGPMMRAPKGWALMPAVVNMLAGSMAIQQTQARQWRNAVTGHVDRSRYMPHHGENVYYWTDLHGNIRRRKLT